MAEHRLNACRTNPRLQPAELFEHLATGFKLPVAAAASKPMLLRHLEDRLSQLRAEGRSAALIVDEAQRSPTISSKSCGCSRISSPTMRSFCRSFSPVNRSLPYGSSEHQLRQFKQRITLRCQLVPFTLQETAAYVFGRVRLAGGDATRLFTRNAVVAIHGASKGIPPSDRCPLR